MAISHMFKTYGGKWGKSFFLVNNKKNVLICLKIGKLYKPEKSNIPIFPTKLYKLKIDQTKDENEKEMIGEHIID